MEAGNNLVLSTSKEEFKQVSKRRERQGKFSSGPYYNPPELEEKNMDQVLALKREVLVLARK